MITQILLYGAVAAVLVCALFLFIRSRRNSAAPSQDISAKLNSLPNLFGAASGGARIQSVASEVSARLKESGQCDKIVFLRKQRNLLELNYYHGIHRFDRTEFRIPFRAELVSVLRETFVPRSIDRLSDIIPPALDRRLRTEGMLWFTPIFWQENIYGLYFFRTSLDPVASQFSLLAASLAHSLSAAYHIRWYESRLEKLMVERKQAESAPAGANHREPTRDPLPILRLVRHASMESLIPHLADTIQREMGVDRLLLIYEDGASSHLLSAGSGTAGRLDTPSRDSFNQIMAQLGEHRVVPIESLSVSGDPWLRRAAQSGFSAIARFLVAEGRRGLMLLDGRYREPELTNRLLDLEPSTQALVANAELIAQMQELSFTDSLTGLSNQRYFRKRLREEIDRARRYGRSLALIIFDLDDLKSVNDSYGHLAGDEVIRRMGPILRGSIRAIDIVARYGGDEFCVIMPEADDKICLRFMERLNQRFSGNRFSLPGINAEIGCTISLGGAIFPAQASNDDELIFAADMALLQAKASGRNRFLLFSPVSVESGGTSAEPTGF